jgi:hypothetical protein
MPGMDSEPGFRASIRVGACLAGLPDMHAAIDSGFGRRGFERDAMSTFSVGTLET